MRVVLVLWPPPADIVRTTASLAGTAMTEYPGNRPLKKKLGSKKNRQLEDIKSLRTQYFTLVYFQKKF